MDTSIEIFAILSYYFKLGVKVTEFCHRTSKVEINKKKYLMKQEKYGHTYLYIYIYIYTHIHTHTHALIYVYIYK